MTDTSGRKKPAEKIVLCIDDEEGVLNALERALRKLKVTVAKTLTGVAGLRMIESGAIDPDLIFLDLRMPGMDGFEFLKKFREVARKDIPVVVLTGDARDESVLRGYGEGAAYYLTKPFENHQVVNITQYLIGDLDESERARLETEL